jgi:hypothetical protein
MSADDEANGVASAKAERKPWSAPRVILSELRTTRHLVGKTPLSKVSFNTDHSTPSGSVGS